MRSNLKVGLDFNGNNSIRTDVLHSDIRTKEESDSFKFQIDEPPLHSHLKTNQVNEPDKTNDRSIGNAQLANWLMENHRFVKIANALYIFDENLKHYHVFYGEYSDLFVRKVIPETYAYKINSNSIREIIQWLKSNSSLELGSSDIILRKNYIAFKNVVFDYKTNSVHKHNPNYYFTSLLNVNYPKDEQEAVSSNYFEQFMADITNGNTHLYNRIQELVGYIISEIREIKYIPFLLGPKDSGKSVFLRLVEHLVGENNTSNLSIEQLNKPDYLIQIIGKRLNTCGEISEVPLNKLDTLKKLSGGDTITVRGVYATTPIEFVNSAALIFAGNDFPNIKHTDKSMAFTDRLLVIPFLNRIEKKDQDIQLFDKLKSESSYIAFWAIKGLKRLQKNNYEFTTCPEIIKIENNYKKSNNSIQTFLDSSCIFGTELKIYYSDLVDAYKHFCLSNNIIPTDKTEFLNYIKQNCPVKNKRFRLNGSNENGFFGISLKNAIEEDV